MGLLDSSLYSWVSWTVGCTHGFIELQVVVTGLLDTRLYSRVYWTAGYAGVPGFSSRPGCQCRTVTGRVDQDRGTS